jgi:DNA helicase TIP49 (TBP-interacting protein)
MKRYLEEYIRKDLKRKIILLTGPRQTGKTTLAKMLSHHFDYFNYDNAEHLSLDTEKTEVLAEMNASRVEGRYPESPTKPPAKNVITTEVVDHDQYEKRVAHGVQAAAEMGAEGVWL